MASNGNFTHQNLYKEYADQHQTAPPAAAAPAAAAATTDASVSAPAGNSNLSKDEVGWYFVEQYYTTLSKSPEKLHVCLFSPVRARIFTDQLGSSSTASARNSSTVLKLKLPTSPSVDR
jgi:hypothetical protein